MSTFEIVFLSVMGGLITGALLVFIVVIIVWWKADNKKSKVIDTELQKAIQEREEIIRRHEESLHKLDELQKYVDFVEAGANEVEGTESTNCYTQIHLEKLKKYQELSIGEKFNLIIRYLEYSSEALVNKMRNACQKSKTNIDFDALLQEETIKREAAVTSDILSKTKCWQKTYENMDQETREYVLSKLRKLVNRLICNSIFNLPEVKELGVQNNEN